MGINARSFLSSRSHLPLVWISLYLLSSMCTRRFPPFPALLPACRPRMSERVAFPMNERGGSRGKSTLPKFTSVGREGIEGWPACLPAFVQGCKYRESGINIMKFLHSLIHICDLDHWQQLSRARVGGEERASRVIHLGLWLVLALPYPGSWIVQSSRSFYGH